MGIILILSIMATFGGAVHIVQIIWTKANKDKLLAKHKPGTIAHKIDVTNLSTRRLIVTILGTIASAVLLTVVVREVVRVRGDSADVILLPASIMAVVAISLAVYVSYNFYRKNS